jgi:hypothetical protein
MTHPATDPAQGSETARAAVHPRRKLLRGAMAMPAVLTVCSGSALATSSFGRCLNNALADPVTGPVTSSASTDNLVRVALWEQDLGGGVKAYFVDGSSFPNPPLITSPVPGPGRWQPFDLVNNQLTGTSTDVQPPGSTQSTDKFVAVRYDADGEIVGVGATGGGTAIGQSCWTSFAVLKSGL